MMNLQLNQTLKAHHSYKSGLLTEEEWSSFATQLGELLATDGGERYKQTVLKSALGQQPAWQEVISEAEQAWPVQ